MRADDVLASYIDCQVWALSCGLLSVSCTGNMQSKYLWSLDLNSRMVVSVCALFVCYLLRQGTAACHASLSEVWYSSDGWFIVCLCRVYCKHAVTFPQWGHSMNFVYA